MRISNRIMAEHIKANLARQSSQLIETQLKLATGKRINKPSDDPIGVGQALDYRTTLQTIEQYRENIVDAQTRIEYTESILDQMDSYIDDARDIAANPDTEDKAALAQEIGNIRDQVLNLSKSKYDESYIFSGHMSDTEPFTQTSPYTYQGDAGSHRVMVGADVTVKIEADGSIFVDDYGGPGEISLFQVLDNLETAIATEPFDRNAVQSALEPLDRISQQIELARANHASDYQRLERTEEYWKNFSNSVETMRQNVEDADITETAIEMQVQQTAYEVLLATAAQVIQPTLVNFIG